MRKVLILTAALLMFAQATSAKTIGRGYSNTEFRTLTQTFFALYNGGNPTDEMLDEYAQMAYCSLYKKHFSDDFKWAQIRGAIRNGFKAYNSNYHRAYQIKGNLVLERYDVEKGVFPIAEENQHNNVGHLYLYSPDAYFNFCGRTGNLDVLPTYYTLTVFEPFNLKEIEVPSETAQKLVPYMANAGEGRKKIYARYRVNVLDFEKLEGERQLKAEFKGQMESVDFFLDENMTQKIHSINYGVDF